MEVFNIDKYKGFKSYSLSDNKNIPLDFKLDHLIKKENGFYIELGANDGLTQSNTAFFEFNRGWKGVLIEPSINVYNNCVKNRPNSNCYNYACVSNEYEFNEIKGDFDGNLMSSVNGKRLNKNSSSSVQAITLEKILDKNEVSNIDLLSLDTEGYELNILKGLNLNKYRPNYMIIEVYNYDYQNIVDFLNSHNYSLLGNFTNYNKIDNPLWDGSHNDFIFKDNLIKMKIVYCFIGKLPNYCLDTVYQLRLFYKGDVYFIVNDYDSEYIQILKNKYNVNIVKYEDVISNEFINVVNNYRSKFCIVNGLSGRENLFIYSFERFFCLYNLMKIYDLTDVFFLELDNLLYDDPLKWKEKFSVKNLAYMFDNYDRCSSGIFYVKNIDSLLNLNNYFLHFIQNSNKFISEMGALYEFWERNKDEVQMLPILWNDDSLPSMATSNYENYDNSIFDALPLGVYLCGYEPFHTNGVIVKNMKSKWSLVDYTKYKYKWEIDDKGRKIPYILNENTNIWNRINNLHIHSKNLKEYLSKHE